MAANKHAAITSRDVLDWVEREASGISNGPNMLTFIPGAHGQRTVFHHLEVMPLSHGHDRVHLTRDAQKVHQADRLGALSNLLLQLRRVDITGSRFTIHKHRTGTDHFYCVGCGYMRLRRNEHLVARSDTELPVSQMQCCHAGTYRDTVDIAAHEISKLYLKSFVLWTVRQNIPLQYFQDGFALKIGNPGASEWDGSGCSVHKYWTSVIEFILSE